MFNEYVGKRAISRTNTHYFFSFEEYLILKNVSYYV
jgi:hypothetical protein